MPVAKTTPRFGAYRVLREVDQDSLGTLYEAEHPRLHKKVAVRSIGAAAARDVTHSRRFLLELRSYVALEHPAIPRLYELTYQGDCPYLVTEIIPGKTLDDALNEGDQHDPLGVIELLEPIASALDYAHARATIHRDVKPANILLAEDGRTMLTGFGLGTIASFSNGPGAAGPMAPDYVAPERLVGREVDSRADIYSLAAVIFHAVTGQRPFTSRSWIETLSRRLYEPPPSSSDIVADLPEEFSQNLQQAMDRDPARRPASAGELLARLRATLDAPPQTEEKIHWLHPHMHRGSMVVSGVLVFLVGIAGVTWLLDGAGLSLMVKFSHVIGGH
ncbi:MAG: serine/threonine protein kinase [Chloroflexi bacterium]|nr:MAG: serine/threonine protein kinase [Chloroflexota bacterium]TME92431.1 MAG: serine/threonine protein kinase [Chloroflexota bacterium]